MKHVTVFTPCYNQGKYLAKAIKSVLDQTYSQYEYLLFDDGSTDDTAEIMDWYAMKDSRIKVTKLPKQKNIATVLNLAIDQMQGEYFVWVPADDVVDFSLLWYKYNMSLQYPDSVIYDDWNVIEESGEFLQTVTVKEMTPQEFNREVWVTSPIGFTGIWIPAKILKEQKFPEHLQYSEDFYWMIEATLRGVEFRHIQMILHKKRKHANTLTAKNHAAIMEQVHTIREELRSKYAK